MKFRCPNCSQKITAPADRAGKVGRCPRCKGKITVPRPVEPESQADATPKILTLIDPPPLVLTETPRPSERARLEAEHKSAANQNNDELLTSLGITPKTRYAGKRQMVWLLDILLYPTSRGGLTTLGIMTGLTMLLLIFGAISLIGWVLAGVIVLYVGWSLAECVYDSAIGGVRAPAAPSVGFGEMWSRVSYFIAVYVVYVFPPVIYYLFTRQADLIFLGLSTWMIVFFPMALVAMAIMDSTTALNPFILLWAILRTFFSYAAFLIFLVAVTLLMGWLWGVLADVGPFLLRLLVALAGSYYTAMVQAHLLGRFYWRNRERLDWGA